MTDARELVAFDVASIYSTPQCSCLGFWGDRALVGGLREGCVWEQAHSAWRGVPGCLAGGLWGCLYARLDGDPSRSEASWLLTIKHSMMLSRITPISPTQAWPTAIW